MYTLTHWGTVHVLRHPQMNIQLRPSLLLLLLQYRPPVQKKIKKCTKKCKNQVLEKPAQQQNPHRAKTLKSIKTKYEKHGQRF